MNNSDIDFVNFELADIYFPLYIIQLKEQIISFSNKNFDQNNLLSQQSDYEDEISDLSYLENKIQINKYTQKLK